MNNDNKDFEEKFLKMKEALATAKSSLDAAERWSDALAKHAGIETDTLAKKAEEIPTDDSIDTTGELQIVEGIFDGQNMHTADGEHYPVPVNYASKSKLVEGDILKLTIQPNGAFVYKQTHPVDRRLVVGSLVLDGSQYKILAEGKSYNVLYASVTYYRAKVGDDVTIIIPAEGAPTWAAVENVLPRKDEVEV